MKKRFRMSPNWGLSSNRAALGPLVDWQEWFGGYYWLKVELWLIILVVEVEITNRPLDDEVVVE